VRRAAGLALVLFALAACGRDPQERRGGGQPPAVVRTEVLQPSDWIDTLEAIGSARARDSVTITAAVSETIDRVHFDSGDSVRKGQVLATLSGREQRATLAAAEAEYRAAQTLYARQVDLAKRQLIAACQFDAQRATRDAARARLEQMRAQLGDRAIVAPFDGVLGMRQVSPGALVTPGTAITTLDDIGTIELDFSVPERQLAAVKVGQAVEATSPAFPGATFHGQVVALDPRLDPDSRALAARAEFANPDHRLRPGMLLEARIAMASRTALQVPELAIQQVGRQAFVFTVGTDGKVAQMPVTLGARRPGFVEIASGVRAGDRVVVEGVVKLRPGAKVSEAGADAAKPSAPRAAH
jgi:membrane fusion protein (multidrug efflux system)